jgi:hypothetical protein
VKTEKDRLFYNGRTLFQIILRVEVKEPGGELKLLHEYISH